jgi:hypothetical protein
MSDTGRKDITDRKCLESSTHPPMFRLSLDISQGSLRRSPLTPRSLLSTRPASLHPLPTIVARDPFSQAILSLPPRSYLMKLVPIPALPKTLHALTPTQPRTLPALTPTQPRTLQALTLTQPRTLPALTLTQPRTLPALTPAQPKTLPALTLTQPRTLPALTPAQPRTMPALIPTQPKTMQVPPKMLARATSNKHPTWLPEF